jgi:Methyltransferase domain
MFFGGTSFSLCRQIFSAMNDFEPLIAGLDLGLFSAIASQSTDEDKRSWLACQLAVREMIGEYKYLEIGSYLGGSIQPYLLDPRCARIYSIDKRPDTQPDERGIDYVYKDNSTARMIDNLRRIAPDQISKVVTIDGDTREMSWEGEGKIDLCLIDGEHTDAAVLSDFKFCLDAVKAVGAIMFDDAQITYNGLRDCIDHLEQRSTQFNAYALPDKIFVIEIGDFALHAHPRVYERLLNNHKAYLFSLQDNDRFRRFANRTPFRLLRRFLVKVRGGNVSY